MGEFEGPDSVRLQSMGVPRPGNSHVTDTEFSGQSTRAPMRGILGFGMQRRLDDFLS